MIVMTYALFISARPPWNPSMTVEELDANERQAFLIWRRSLARFFIFIFYFASMKSLCISKGTQDGMR